MEQSAVERSGNVAALAYTIAPEFVADRVIPILAIASGPAESIQAKPLVTRTRATRNTAEMTPVMRDSLCIMSTNIMSRRPSKRTH